MFQTYHLLTVIIIIASIVAMVMRDSISAKLSVKPTLVLGVAVIILILALYFGRNVPKELFCASCMCN